jgi:hypothetical protein
LKSVEVFDHVWILRRMMMMMMMMTLTAGF